MTVRAEAFRDRFVQPLADEAFRLLGLNCFAAARVIIRAAAVGVGAFLFVDCLKPPFLLRDALGWIALAIVLDVARKLWCLDRDIREQERRVDWSDGSARAVWPRFRDATDHCAVRAVGLWSWLVMVLLAFPHVEGPVLVLHRIVDVIAYGGGGVATMLLTCEARRPPPLRDARLADGMA